MSKKSEYDKAYYAQNKERFSARAKEYYQRTKETAKARSKARYEANKESCYQQSLEWKAKNPEKFKQAQAKWLKTNPTYNMYHNAKRRAKELNIPFDLQWKELVIPTHCPILGIKLWQEGYRDSAPSLDKIKPELGYVKSNVKIISLKANRIKAEGSAEDHERIADYIRNPDKY